MTILLTFDDGYACHASVVMESIIRNCNQKLRFAILYSDISNETIEIFRKHYNNRVQSLDFVRIEKEEFLRFRNAKTIEHIPNPEVVLLRLFCDRVNEDRFILYLDCDLVVVDDVLKIMEYADEHNVLSAVNEYSNQYKYSAIHDLPYGLKLKNSIDPWVYEAFWYRTFEDLGMSHKGKYFNAGVMLINIKLWREYNIGQKCLDYLENNSELCIATDQDALNHVIDGAYTELPPRWNPNLAINVGIFTNYSLHQIRDAKENPALFHTTGEVKPWHEECDNKIRNLYTEYRNGTPWPDFTMQSVKVNDGALGILRRKVRRTISSLLGRKLKRLVRIIGHLKKITYYCNNNKFFTEGRVDSK